MKLPSRICLLAAFVLGGAGPLASALDAAGSDRAEDAYDCGALALCTLLRLEGRPITLAELPPLSSAGKGQSMKDLKAIAARHGLALSGIRLAPPASAIDRPALVFIDRKPHGHYLVVRPVGPSGRLVQVIDPGREPFVLDAVDLFRSPGWTGVALVPGRSNRWGRIAGIVAAIIGLAWVVGRFAPKPAPTVSTLGRSHFPDRPESVE